MGHEKITKKCEKNVETFFSQVKVKKLPLFFQLSSGKQSHFIRVRVKTHTHTQTHTRERERKKKKKMMKKKTKKKEEPIIAGGGGVKTRARKRKVGQRDSFLLWDVIVKCDDICFTRVLPRLSATDIKLLYGANKETRKLIKRSSRRRELKKKFWIEEMSSISTLEVAWEHFPWGTFDYDVEEVMDETYFCSEVARTNKLELLQWIREEKKCEWDRMTINAAARQGNLEMVKYCVANECPIDEMACAYAALKGRLECLKYFREEVKAPWDSSTASRAALNGHLHILEYLVERKFDQYDEWKCFWAAGNGHLDCLKYLHETAKAPWESRAVRKAHENGYPECVQYLLDNDCPLPLLWRYEGGELHTS